MPRALQPEILDTLPPGDPAAQRNREDLRRINRLMGNTAWFARALARHLQTGDRILEIGAGTGEMGQALARRGFAVDGLDLWPRPAGWPPDRAWHRADLREFDGYGEYRVILANLILHQFSDAELGRLAARWGQVRVVLACEPARRRRFTLLWRLLAPLIRANYVSRHDARVSIEAGFVAPELPRSLGLSRSEWKLRECETLRGAYRLVAVRAIPADAVTKVAERASVSGSTLGSASKRLRVPPRSDGVPPPA